MRLWSLDPALLDQKGLVACWREALLAQKVLRGLTTGYRHHPQLDRFWAHTDPVDAIGAYLAGLADAADERGYNFDQSRIVKPQAEPALIEVTDGQLKLEYHILRTKVRTRNPDWYHTMPSYEEPNIPRQHRLFKVITGEVADWERANA